MPCFFLAVLFIVSFVFLMRHFFVKPIFSVIRNCGTSLANMAMYFAMRGGDFWLNQCYQAREELDIRERAIARIKEFENSRLSHFFMTKRELKEYNEFFAKVERCKKALEAAQKDYEKFGKKTDSPKTNSKKANKKKTNNKKRN